MCDQFWFWAFFALMVQFTVPCVEDAWVKALAEGVYGQGVEGSYYNYPHYFRTEWGQKHEVPSGLKHHLNTIGKKIRSSDIYVLATF